MVGGFVHNWDTCLQFPVPGIILVMTPGKLLSLLVPRLHIFRVEVIIAAFLCEEVKKKHCGDCVSVWVDDSSQCPGPVFSRTLQQDWFLPGDSFSHFVVAFLAPTVSCCSQGGRSSIQVEGLNQQALSIYQSRSTRTSSGLLQRRTHCVEDGGGQWRALFRLWSCPWEDASALHQALGPGLCAITA